MLRAVWSKWGLYIRYIISGGIGALSQIGTLAFWVEILYHGDESSYRGGIVAGFLVALAVTFTLQKYWTFGDRDTGRLRHQFFWYTLLALGNLAATAGGMYLLVERMHVWYLVANVFTVGTIAVVNFLLNRFWTFRHVLS